MDRSADLGGILAALHRASVLGIHFVDATDVYAWGLTREFAAVRAACCAQIVSAAAGRADRRLGPPPLSRLRQVVGYER